VGYSLKPFIRENLPIWKSQKEAKLEVGQTDIGQGQPASGKEN
jgi:hypothetical protein